MHWLASDRGPCKLPQRVTGRPTKGHAHRVSAQCYNETSLNMAVDAVHLPVVTVVNFSL